jgi:hypothetical protein
MDVDETAVQSDSDRSYYFKERAVDCIPKVDLSTDAGSCYRDVFLVFPYVKVPRTASYHFFTAERLSQTRGDYDGRAIQLARASERSKKYRGSDLRLLCDVACI